MPNTPTHATPDTSTALRYYKPAKEGRQTLTRERIRQIETIAMRKMKREFARRGISVRDLLG